jgi:hypothetical protein
VALKKAVMDGGKEATTTEGKTVTGDIVDARAALSQADANPPEAPVITSPKNDSYDNDGKFTVSGTAEKGSTVELFERLSGGDEVTKGKKATVDRLTGEWSIELPDVAEGSHTYAAKATDAVGNTSAASAALKVTVDKTAPKVDSIRPQDRTKDVSRSIEPTATFVEDVDPATLNDTTVKLVNTATGKQVRIEVSCNEPCRRVTLDPYRSDPSKLLARHHRYRVIITTGVKDLAGNTLAKKVVWSFTTER